MSNISVLDLSTIRPAVRVERLRSYIIVPACGAKTVDIGSGSYVVWCSVPGIQYNYTAPGSFTLPDKVVMPTGADFVATVKWRSGANLYRYKLWENIGETMPGVKLYTNEIIRANFCVELFTIDGTDTLNHNTAFTIRTSTTLWPTGSSLRDRTEYALATGADAGTLTIDISGSVDLPFSFPDASTWLDNS